MKIKRISVLFCVIGFLFLVLFILFYNPEKIYRSELDDSFISISIKLKNSMNNVLHSYIETSVLGVHAIDEKSAELFDYYNNKSLSMHYFLTSIFYFTTDDINKAIENSNKSLEVANMSMEYIYMEIYNIFLQLLSSNNIETVEYSINQLMSFDFSRDITKASISLLFELSDPTDYTFYNSQDAQQYFEFIIWFRESLYSKGYAIDDNAKEFLLNTIDMNTTP